MHLSSWLRAQSAVRRLVLGGAVVLLVLTAGAFTAEAVRDALFAARVEDGAARIVALAGIERAMPIDEQVDRLRTFVTRNSVHRIDDEFYSYWHDLPQVIHRMMAFANGAGPPPHLECSSRTELMEAVLAHLGHDTRGVAIFEDAAGFPSHTFLEVFDRTNGRWHVQDPDYDLYWVLAATGQRASIFDLVALPFTDVMPCNGSGCGWGLESWEGNDAARLRTYLGLASVVDREKGERPLLVNTTRFDLAAPQVVDGAARTFCEFAGKNCRQDIHRFAEAAAP
jgi:hypothetical protein